MPVTVPPTPPQDCDLSRCIDLEIRPQQMEWSDAHVECVTAELVLVGDADGKAHKLLWGMLPSTFGEVL